MKAILWGGLLFWGRAYLGDMKQLLTLALCLFSLGAMAQGSFPYNPDANENGTVGSEDLLAFLSVYGSAFLPSGVLPVAGGGTGVSTLDSARLALGVSTFADVIPLGQSGPEAQVTGDLHITQNLNQGQGNVASGLYAAVSGRGGTASGTYSFVTNQNSTATATCSSAIGEGTSATATAAHSQGFGSEASGLAAHAEGYYTVASSSSSHAEGYQTEASANYAHAEGYQSDATGLASHAQGYRSTASGLYSHASGRNATASANSASAIGYNVTADQANSTVVGQWNALNQGGLLFAVGNGEAEDDRSDALQVDTAGNVLAAGRLFAEGSDLLQLVINLQAQVDSMQIQLNLLQGE